eukprot:GHVU01214525.1.p1 GENE.GHVU01214525.1~~GHVU01214525.1.p1  ORF type:complete len:221 (-),score=17.53 GHVU01214525.1:778-1440(-)
MSTTVIFIVFTAAALLLLLVACEHVAGEVYLPRETSPSIRWDWTLTGGTDAAAAFRSRGDSVRAGFLSLAPRPVSSFGGGASGSRHRGGWPATHGRLWMMPAHPNGNEPPKLGRKPSHRKALLRNLTTAVLRHGRITTTEAKAKAVRGSVDRMIKYAKRGDQHGLVLLRSWIYDPHLAHDIWKEAPRRYAERGGGYCRVTKQDRLRRGDGARMAVVELMP